MHEKQQNKTHKKKLRNIKGKEEAYTSHEEDPLLYNPNIPKVLPQLFTNLIDYYFSVCYIVVSLTHTQVSTKKKNYDLTESLP